MSRFSLICSIIVLWSFPSASFAGRVFVKKLEEAVCLVDDVVLASLVRSINDPSDPAHIKRYEIRVERILSGNLSTKLLKVFSSYTWPSSVRRGPNGKTIRVSPIVSHFGSGLEGLLKKDSRYVILLDRAPFDPVKGRKIFRAEHDSALEKIPWLQKNCGDSK